MASSCAVIFAGRRPKFVTCSPIMILPSVMFASIRSTNPTSTRQHILISGALRSINGCFSGFGGCYGRATGVPNRNENTNYANKPNDGTKHSPECRLGSRVCGLPLGTKIGSTIIFARLAWLFMGRRLDRFDNLDGRGRRPAGCPLVWASWAVLARVLRCPVVDPQSLLLRSAIRQAQGRVSDND